MSVVANSSTTFVPSRLILSACRKPTALLQPPRFGLLCGLAPLCGPNTLASCWHPHIPLLVHQFVFKRDLFWPRLRHAVTPLRWRTCMPPPRIQNGLPFFGPLWTIPLFSILLAWPFGLVIGIV